jgi:hypothetical protein
MKLIRVSSELEPWLVRDLNRRTSLRRVEISLRILISSSEFEIWVRARLDRGQLLGRAIGLLFAANDTRMLTGKLLPQIIT